MSSVRTAFLAFFIPTVLPIIVRFLVQGGTVPVAMGVLGLSFAVALVAIARNFHASIVESLNLRFENYELIRSLSVAKEQAEAAMHVAKQAEEALRQAYQELERRVEERTAELSTANALLRQEIAERQRVEEDLLKAKEAAEAANRVKSEFLATMSHELRTPLSVILGYGSLLVEGMLGSLSEEQVHSLRRINNSARELLDLITAILDVSRLEAGRLPTEIQRVEVPTLLEEIKAETEAERERVDLLYTWTIQGDLPLLYTDPGKLKIVLKNLIRNAVKFTEEGSVTVEAQGLCGGIEVSVSDTGIGIPVEALEFIFEPFRQVGTPSSGRRGIGLGLHIVKRLLALLGGTIRVESKLGAGSTFRVWVPREHSISLNVPSDVVL